LTQQLSPDAFRAFSENYSKIALITLIIAINKLPNAIVPICYINNLLKLVQIGLLHLLATLP